MAQGEKIIGIDLGTTNSVVSVMEGSDLPAADDSRRVGPVLERGQPDPAQPARFRFPAHERQQGGDTV